MNRENVKVVEPYCERCNETKLEKWRQEVLEKMGVFTNRELQMMRPEIRDKWTMFLKEYTKQLFFKFTKEQYDKKLARMGAKQGNQAQTNTNANKLSDFDKKADTTKPVGTQYDKSKSITDNILIFLTDKQGKANAVNGNIMFELFNFLKDGVINKPTQEEK